MRYNILIVEDDEGLLHHLRQLFLLNVREMVSITCVSTLGEAMEALGMDTHAVLLDLNLPDSKGRATYDVMASISMAPVVVLCGDDYGLQGELGNGIVHIKPDISGAMEAVAVAMLYKEHGQAAG